ncbi:MAG TPA: hypothetical protein VNT20_18365 [Flavisolibacter sp.]|jgi:hypothetical protein|nr:hypothetical protein [Flavisolibacter sp.]
MNCLIRFVPVWLLLLIVNCAGAQDSSKLDRVIAFPNKLFAALDKKTASVESKLNKQTDKYVSKMQRQERRLRKKVWRKDSTLAKQMFDGTNEKYEQLKHLNSSTSQHLNSSSVYSGHLDSLTTALSFLKNQNVTDNPSLQKSLEQYKELQSKLNSTDQVKKYITQRRELLKQQFEKLGMVKQLKQYRKQVYYYQQQVREYKELFEDPNKIEAKLMDIAMKLPQFKNFFAKNSLLGSMFHLPGSNDNIPVASIQGLQTRALISQTIADRFGTGANVNQMLQQNVQLAQGQLNQLKNKVSSYKSGSYGNTDDDDIPGFKPNNEKTKSFLQRLEYGGNIQSQKARYFFPVTSDIALSLGYKINNKSSIGLGASYKLGWGNNWSNIKLSHQGVGLRSYLDWKIKGSLYVSGGYEQNHRNMINTVDQLRDYSSWQTSGLIGLSKKYSISKKMKGEMKLLWDFMSYQQVPKAQPILFRVGYSLK